MTLQPSVAIATCRKICFPQFVLLQYKTKPYLGFQNLGCHSKILGCHFDTQKRLKKHWVRPSQKEHAISAVNCKKKGMLLQPLSCSCIERVIHHKENVHKEQHPNFYVTRTSNNRVISSGDLYCCLLQ